VWLEYAIRRKILTDDDCDDDARNSARRKSYKRIERQNNSFNSSCKLNNDIILVLVTC